MCSLFSVYIIIQIFLHLHLLTKDLYRKHSTGSIDDDFSVKHKQIIKKIQAIKKKLKHFEESFEQEQGFKHNFTLTLGFERKVIPDRWSCPRKISTTLYFGHYEVCTEKCRIDFKIGKLKEEAEMGSRSRHGCGASSSGERMDPPDRKKIYGTNSLY
ncbi:unnamed protein product [Mytilus edulis]|uniref:Uncharacterized protein n=1 Tax=Mytilus edulis TaxID=6550 RepID=A0A8S3U4Z8_MYTED|nr:unnamed protein product [Mytilus edulis]